MRTHNTFKLLQASDVIRVQRPRLFQISAYEGDKKLICHTSTKLGTQEIRSHFVSTKPLITDSGVGIIAGDKGSKTADMKPHAAYMSQSLT